MFSLKERNTISFPCQLSLNVFDSLHTHHHHLINILEFAYMLSIVTKQKNKMQKKILGVIYNEYISSEAGCFSVLLSLKTINIHCSSIKYSASIGAFVVPNVY